MNADSADLEPFFASDLAAEVRREYQSRSGHGLPAAEATRHVLDTFRDLLTDPQEGPVIFLALAAAQVGEGAVLEVVRDAALELIRSGEARRAYASADPQHMRQRKQLLAALEQRLEEFGPVSPEEAAD